VLQGLPLLFLLDLMKQITFRGGVQITKIVDYFVVNVARFPASKFSQALPSAHVKAAGIKPCSEQWWEDTDMTQQNYSKTSICQCHLDQHTPHIDWNGIELGPSK